MTRFLSMFKFARMQPPVRRVLALDAGSRTLKLLLVESHFARLRLLKEELIDLQAEGLVSADETKAHLQTLLEAWGRPPLALVLPQHLSTSQLIDLPLAPESEVEKLIQNETVKLSGVSQTRIVYDFVAIDSPAKNRQQFWVTLCQEGDIRDRIQGLGIEQDDICEVTTTANALITAFRATSPQCSRAILVHLGAQTTVVVILVAGQGGFATSFQMGTDFFTRALARLRNCSEDAAESLKRKTNLLSGPEACPEFASEVDGWIAELKRQLNEWFAENRGMAAEVATFELVGSGSGFEQPGLLEYLKQEGALEVKPWPKGHQTDMAFPSKGFEVAFGTALQALGYSAQPVSLLLEDYRAVWKKRLVQQRIELASLALLICCVVLLAAGTWHKVSLIDRKTSLLNKVKAGQEAVEVNDSLSGELAAEYETLRPLFAAEQNTLDTLKTLSLMQECRSNRSLWFVLFADQQSYFNPPTSLVSTNKPAKTNVVATTIIGPVLSLPNSPTNVSPAKPGCIAELCVPEEAEAARAVLSQVVNDLKHERLFSKVDSLSDDLRRNLADPKVTLPDRHFVLALDFAETDFQQPLRSKKLPSSVRGGTKRAPRPTWNAPEGAEKTQIQP